MSVRSKGKQFSERNDTGGRRGKAGYKLSTRRRNRRRQRKSDRKEAQ